MAARKKAQQVEQVEDVTDALVEACEQKVRLSRACSIAELAGARLSPRGRSVLVEALEKHGLERAGTKVRVPVNEQVAALVGRQPVPVASLRRGLVGCGAAELKAALTAGPWRLIGRGRALAVAADTVDLLSDTELAELQALSSELAAMEKSVRPKRGSPKVTLLRADVVRAMSAASRWIQPVGVRVERAESEGQKPSVADRVMAGVERATSPTTGLASVPEVVRALAPEVPIAEARDTLLLLARAGRLELRPESGVDLLDAELRALCPPGPRGSVLSYARALSSSSR